MVLSNVEVALIKEALESCKEDFIELYRTKEWFVSDSWDLCESALEILNENDESV